MIEQFRKVEPLRLHAYSDDNHAVLAAMNQGGPFWLWVNMENEGWTVPEARALRDWLNRALPEDV